MGVPDVLAVRARTDLDPWAQHCEFCRAHIDEVLGAVTVPFTVEDITVTALTVVNDQPGQSPHLQVDGTGGGISWPVLIGKPPILVGDPTGRWLQRSVQKRDGTVQVELVELPAEAVGPPDTVTAVRRYRYDPAGGLRTVLLRLKAG